MSIHKKNKSYMARKAKTNARAKHALSVVAKRWYRCIVSRSNKYSYAMIIDSTWKVQVMISDKALKVQWTKIEKAHNLGKTVAEKALAHWIKEIIFDRNGYLYHWRVAAIADWLREWWLLV